MNKRVRHIFSLAIVLILLNIFNQRLYTRIDLTSDKRYTLVGSTFNDPLGIRSNLI